MTAQEVIAEIQGEFALLGSWEDRYAHIIDMGKHLPAYPEEYRTDTFKVKGCTSQVWLHPTFTNGRIHFDADSDAIIVKGLVALLMRIYNDRTPDEILAIPGDFVRTLGLDTHLSPNRANGLASMVKQIALYALAMKERVQSPDDAHSSNTGSAVSRDAVIDALHTVFDPEIPIDIYELGLIYEVRVQPNGHVHIVMTLTTPNCPSAQTLPADVERAVSAVPGVQHVHVEITFDPPWDKTMMSEAALFSIGLF